MPGRSHGYKDPPPVGRAELWGRSPTGWRLRRERERVTVGEARAMLASAHHVVEWTPATGPPVVLGKAAATLNDWAGR